MRVGSANSRRAVEQHTTFVDTLRRNACHLLHVPFIHGAYDSVFAKDAAVLIETGRIGTDGGENTIRRALLASPRYDERRVEQSARACHLARHGFEVTMCLPTLLEGGDVVIAKHTRIALLGHGFRSSPRSADGLARFLGTDVVTLALRDPTLYHLDTALAVLDDGALVLCEEAFTREALRALSGCSWRCVKTVRPEDARRFVLNVVDLGNVVVSGSACDRTAELWRSLGRDVVVSPLDEFHCAGGSAACLLARVHTASAQGSRAQSPTAAILSSAA
jgi:N-dimethylarginine dimethylaminohydrolase